MDLERATTVAYDQQKSEEDESKDEKDSIWVNFASNTTAHGFAQIVINNSPALKLIWILVIIGFNVALYFQIKPLVMRYLERPVSTKFTLQPTQRQIFPMITVCNINNLVSSKMSNLSEDNPMAGIRNDSTELISYNYSCILTQSTIMPTAPPVLNESWYGMESSTNITTTPGYIYGHTYGYDYNECDFYNAYIPKTDNVYNVTKKDLKQFQEKNEILEFLSEYVGKKGPEIKTFGHQFNEMFMSCKWKDYYDCKDKKYWQMIWHWRYGNCYVFNSARSEDGARRHNNLNTVDSTGPSGGLSINFFVNQDEYYKDFLTEEAGIVIHIAEPGSRSEPYHNGINLAPNFAHYIGLKKTKITRVDPFQNNSCIQHRTIDLGIRSLNQQYIDKYSLRLCKDICLAETQIERCGCTSYQLPSLNMSNVCTRQHAICTAAINDEYLDERLPCLQKCQSPCEEVEYNVKISARMYPTQYTKKSDTFDKNLSHSILKVAISFDSLSTMTIQDEEYYRIENLLSDIGGQLGLWSGFSFMTVFEFVLFMFHGVLSIMAHIQRKISCKTSPISGQEKKKKENGKTEKKDTKKSKGSPIVVVRRKNLFS